MKFRMNILIYNKCRSTLFQQSKRYAGHSKWQNIKHTKEIQDAARSALFRSLTNKMRVAISITGVADPAKNDKLALLIDQAKKVNMPVSTINTFLEKMKNKQNKSQTDLLIVRGPGGCTLILYVTSSNPIATKFQLTYHVKKCNSQFADSSALRMFDCASYVLASKKCNLDQAMEDAINIDAQDVQELTDNDQKCFEFKCAFQSSNKSVTQLKNLDYSIISTEDVCIPEHIVKLSEKDLEAVKRLKERLMSQGEIEKIEDNIAESEETSK